jgi:hypothetical protein
MWDSSAARPSKPLRRLADNLRLARPPTGRDPIQHFAPLRNLQRLLLGLLRIHRKSVRRQRPARQMETRPCSPRADLLPFATDPRRQMLEMPHRISDKRALGPVPQHPDQHRIRRRPRFQDPWLPAQVRREGLVELEDGLRRLPFPPKRLRVAKTGVIVSHVFGGQVSGQRRPLGPGHLGQKRTRREPEAFQVFQITARIHTGHSLELKHTKPSHNPISFALKAMQLAGR